MFNVFDESHHKGHYFNLTWDYSNELLSLSKRNAY